MPPTARRAATPIALPPSTTNIRIRNLVATLVATALLLASGLRLHDLTTLHHPSPSWLVKHLLTTATAAPTPHYHHYQPPPPFTTTTRWDDIDNDATSSAFYDHLLLHSPYTHYLLRAAIALFVAAAAYAQCGLAAHRRAVAVTVLPGRGGWTLGYWHPEYFWPLVLVEVGMLVLPLWEPEAARFREGFYLVMCAGLVLVGVVAERRPASLGWGWEEEEEEEERNWVGEVVGWGVGVVGLVVPVLEGRRRRRRGY